MKPDYGLMLAKSGQIAAHHFFYDVPISHLSLSAPGLFTTILNKPHEGREYAVSFDFGSKEVLALIANASPTEQARLKSKLGASQLGDTVEFGMTIVVDLETRLGDIQTGAGEQFIPLVVLRIGQ